LVLLNLTLLLILAFIPFPGASRSHLAVDGMPPALSRFVAKLHLAPIHPHLRSRNGADAPGRAALVLYAAAGFFP
jgi:hypothetical protein